MGQPILQPFLTSFFVLSHPERDGLYVCRWIKALSGPGLTPGEAPRRLSAWPSKSRYVTSPPPLPSPLAGVRRPASMASPRERRLPPPAFRMENPFSVKVLQVFTGFGVGCGVGIGVGRPIYLGMIPGLQQVMSATRGATDAFSGVTRHVNSALRTSGLKNIEAGIGCGVGIGHGFGIGIALKPRVLHGIQSSVGEIMSKLTSKLKDTPELQPALNPMDRSLSSGQQTQNGMHMGLEAKTGESNLKHTTSYEMSRVQHPTQPEALTGSRTEKVIADFLQSPLFHNDTKMDLRDAPPNLQGMDNVLQLVLKHQRVIEELREENENLRQILVEELKVSPTKLQINRRNGVKAYYPCSDCFECRRRSRKTR